MGSQCWINKAATQFYREYMGTKNELANQYEWKRICYWIVSINS